MNLILTHGFLGFRHFFGINYFNGVKEFLEKTFGDGAPAHRQCGAEQF
jgi:hypothetical protein